MNELTDIELRVLIEALDDEYRSLATYNLVIADFGEVRSFINIRSAKARHIEALSALFARHGVPMPANPRIGKVERYASLRTAAKPELPVKLNRTCATVLDSCLNWAAFPMAGRPNLPAWPR